MCESSLKITPAENRSSTVLAHSYVNPDLADGFLCRIVSY